MNYRPQRYWVSVLILSGFIVPVLSCASAKNQLRTELSSLTRERDLLSSQLEAERRLRVTSEQRWNEQVVTLRASLEDARQALQEAETRYTYCKKELQTAEIADKRALMTKLQECGKREPLVRTAAHERGMREVWQSIEFRGYPHTKHRDFWIDDHYFTFEVHVKGRTHKWTVQTKSDETGFAKAIHEIFDMAAVFALKKGRG